MAIATYSTGTVSVANGDTAIVGVSTVWSGVNARPGDDIVIAGHTVIVKDVTDTLHLVIDAWPYSSVTAGAAYEIIQRSPLRFVGGQAMADVSSLIAVLNGMGTIYAVVGDAPDPSIGEDGQYALKTNTGAWQLWLKSGGLWELQSQPVGVVYVGEWDSATPYVVNDRVSQNGSSYIAKQSNTNRSPVLDTSFTYWDGAGIKGDIGNTGAAGSPGTAATVAVNSVATLAAGSSATITNLGTSSAASLAFGIPKGDTGLQGPQGNQGTGIQPDASGTFTQRAAFDGQTTGYKFLETDVSPFRLYVKASNTSGDWAGPTFIGGNFPVGDMGHITDSIVQTFDFGHIV